MNARRAVDSSTGEQRPRKSPSALAAEQPNGPVSCLAACMHGESGPVACKASLFGILPRFLTRHPGADVTRESILDDVAARAATVASYSVKIADKEDEDGDMPAGACHSCYKQP